MMNTFWHTTSDYWAVQMDYGKRITIRKLEKAQLIKQSCSAHTLFFAAVWSQGDEWSEQAFGASKSSVWALGEQEAMPDRLARSWGKVR